MKYDKEEIIDICDSVDTTTIINFGKSPPPFYFFFKLDGIVDIHSFHDVYYHNDFHKYGIFVYINVDNIRQINCHFDYMYDFYVKGGSVPIIDFNSLIRLKKIKKLCNI